MALANQTAWRVRPGGNNTNGGGFDCGLPSGGNVVCGASGTNGTWSTTAGVTTFTDTVAAAFTAGMVGNAIRINTVDQVMITGFTSATAITIQTPSAANSGGKYRWFIGPSGAQDYSQQNAAQASGTNGACSATTTFTDATANAFTAAMVGNVMYITGGGATTGFYEVVSRTSASAVVLDRAPGTVSGGTWHLGGAWGGAASDSLAVNLTTSGPVLPGNRVYILGSGVPNVAAYTYDYIMTTSQPVMAAGDTTNGFVVYAADPATPNFQTGGKPCIQCGGLAFYNPNYSIFDGFWTVGANLVNSPHYGVFGTYGQNAVTFIIRNCVHDQFGYDLAMCGSGDGNSSGPIGVINCEVFSSVAMRSTNAQMGIFAASSGVYGALIFGCNVHNCVGVGIYVQQMTQIVNCVVAKCGGYGIALIPSVPPNSLVVTNCTIDGNTGGGISVWFNNTNSYVIALHILNNLITNHVAAGSYGVGYNPGTNLDMFLSMFDYNIYYNNTSDIQSWGYGPHDTVLTSSPYVGQATENYTLASPLLGVPNGPMPGHGQAPGTVQSYLSVGAVQPQAGGSGTTTNYIVVNKIEENYGNYEDAA